MKEEKKELFNSLTRTHGITLIALVITIIIIVILASVSISLTLGSNGMFNRAMSAKEQMKIASYKERIDLIIIDLKMGKEDINSPLLLSEIKTELDKEKWVSQTNIIIDNNIEKIELKTKEGYIFYVTENETEYKGKGTVVDTSALKDNNALKLEIVEGGVTGTRRVQITNLAENYYSIEYQIGDTEGEWYNIVSGNTVDVPIGQIIYARLVYGSNRGVIVEQGIGYTKAQVKLKENPNVSNITRKSNKEFSDIFEIIWGEDGTGEIEYKITGTLEFGTDYENTITDDEEETIKYVSDLELGTYKIECTAIGPKSGRGNKQEINNVVIGTLASTEVTDINNNSQTAYGIYSEYDLAKFRDIVNIDKEFTANGKIMADEIDLTNVCSPTAGNWIPIGKFNDKGIATPENGQYEGIFDGNNKEINNLYINDDTLYRQGLFGRILNSGFIKNIIISGEITAYMRVGGICGVVSNNSRIENCINRVEINAEDVHIGGIAGCNAGSTISNCKNEADIKGKGYVGGIVGDIINNITIENCVSIANKKIEAEYVVGGIAGGLEITATQYSCTGTISDCINESEVEATGKIDSVTNGPNNSCAGGMIGYNKEGTTVTRCKNSGEIIAANPVLGGIAGRNYGTVSYCCNSGNVSGGAGSGTAGGIIGNNRGTVQYAYNIAEEVSGTNQVGGICGTQNNNNSAKIESAYNTAEISATGNAGGIIGNLGTGTKTKCINMGTVNNVEITDSTQDDENKTQENVKSWDSTKTGNKLGTDFNKEIGSLPTLGVSFTIMGVTYSF